MKSIPYLPILIALAIFLASCGPAPVANITKSNEQRVTNPTTSNDDLSTLVKGNNSFALDLYQSLPRDQNLVFSPYSISLALAMTYAGARDQTESQMANTLHFDLPPAQLHPAFNALDLALAKNGESDSKDQTPLQLNIANGVWAEQTYPFLQDYLDLIARNYGTGIHQSDFINQFESVRKEINDWVSGKTNNKIKDLLPKGSLDANTRMVLANAIYFKADWLNQFDPNSTNDQSFHLLDGSEIKVPMMGEAINLPYAEGNGFQAVELPYAGNTAAMDIIVPDEGSFEKFEPALNETELGNVFSSMQMSMVSLSLPKFKFTSDFSVADQLKQLGMTDAFDGGLADFSGMTSKKDLCISDVIHKAFVAVDEKGTEAAAATAVIMETTSVRMPDVVLTIDRPFIFIIRDLESGQILFIGRVVNPAQ